MKRIAPVYADAALVVYDKPCGLLSVPGRGIDKADCLVTRARAEFPDALTVHRLDMDTSGLIVLARGAENQRRLSMAFAGRQVDKRYVAVVAGTGLAPRQGRIDLPLVCDWPRRPRQKIDCIEGKPSRTRFCVLDTDAARGVSRLELIPVTGRSHQLRVHLAAWGHPILGDPLYAPEAVRAAAPRLLLHAAVLTLAHPQTGKRMHLAAPVPF